jgi:hypothetical protein
MRHLTLSINRPLHRDQKLPRAKRRRRLPDINTKAVELWGAPGGLAGSVEVPAQAAAGGDDGDAVGGGGGAGSVDGGKQLDGSKNLTGLAFSG